MPDNRKIGSVVRTTELPKGVGSRWLSAVRAIFGMPDYSAHVEHLRRCHPERPIPTPGCFYEEFVRSRYGDGPTRCC